MGIFSRIADIFKSNVNDALDQAENPEKMLKQMVLEMEESVNKATLAVAGAISNEKQLERRITKAVRDKTEWQEKAVKALEANREDLAKAALEKKAIAERNFIDLQPVYQQAKEASVKMRQQLGALKNKLEEARMRQSTLVARSEAAKAQKTIAQSFSGVGSDAFSKFEKYETKIEKLESEADAFTQLANENSNLEQELKSLENNLTVENELQDLKKKMGLLPNSDSENNNKGV